jgi:hypothetical protein
MEGKWQMRIIDEAHCDTTKIYIWRDCGSRREFITNLSGEGGMEIKNFEIGAITRTDDIKPTMTVGWIGGRELLQAIADGLCENGIKAAKAPVVQNELDATKYHLEDMRKLLFYEHTSKPVSVD